MLGRRLGSGPIQRTSKFLMNAARTHPSSGSPCSPAPSKSSSAAPTSPIACRSSAASTPTSQSGLDHDVRHSTTSSSNRGAINKQPITGLMTDRLYQYLLDHTREPPILRQLRDETASMHGGHMQASLRSSSRSVPSHHDINTHPHSMLLAGYYCPRSRVSHSDIAAPFMFTLQPCGLSCIRKSSW